MARPVSFLLYRSFVAGETIAELARAFRLRPQEVEEHIRAVAREREATFLQGNIRRKGMVEGGASSELELQSSGK